MIQHWEKDRISNIPTNIELYIFYEHSQSITIHGRGEQSAKKIKVAAEVQGKVGQNRVKPTLNCLDVKL